MKIEFIYSKRADKFFDKHTNLKEEFEKILLVILKVTEMWILNHYKDLIYLLIVCV